MQLISCIGSKHRRCFSTAGISWLRRCCVFQVPIDFQHKADLHCGHFHYTLHLCFFRAIVNKIRWTERWANIKDMIKRVHYEFKIHGGLQILSWVCFNLLSHFTSCIKYFTNFYIRSCNYNFNGVKFVNVRHFAVPGKDSSNVGLCVIYISVSPVSLIIRRSQTIRKDARLWCCDVYQLF